MHVLAETERSSAARSKALYSRRCFPAQGCFCSTWVRLEHSSERSSGQTILGNICFTLHAERRGARRDTRLLQRPKDLCSQGSYFCRSSGFPGDASWEEDERRGDGTLQMAAARGYTCVG